MANDTLGDDYLATLSGKGTSSSSTSVNLNGLSGSTAGQIPVWNGSIFDAGTVVSGNGISMSITYAPTFGLQIGVNASTLRSTLGISGPWKLNAAAAPTVNDDSSQGYQAASLWFDLTGLKVYACMSAAVGAANWVALN